MARRTKKSAPPAGPVYPMTFETFHQPSLYDRTHLQSPAPSCHNGTVSVRRYRVTFELIDEPVEVLAARLQELWDRSDNHHEWDPLKWTAKKLGVELRGSPGNRRSR